MIGSTCERCHTIHGAGDTRTVGRFLIGGPGGYRGHIPKAPLRTTRAEAIKDVCNSRVAKALDRRA